MLLWAGRLYELAASQDHVSMWMHSRSGSLRAAGRQRSIACMCVLAHVQPNKCILRRAVVTPWPLPS